MKIFSRTLTLLSIVLLVLGCSPNSNDTDLSKIQSTDASTAFETNIEPLDDESIVNETERITLAVNDSRPSLGFKNQGHILAKDSARGIELVTRNVEEVQLELVRIPEAAALQTLRGANLKATQLNGYEFLSLLNNAATPVWSGSLKVKAENGQTTSTVIPMREILSRLPQGLFALVVADKSNPSAILPSTIDKFVQEGNLWSVNVPLQWILSTNIGVTAARYPKGMLVNVRSLDQAVPQRAAQVRLFTQANEQIFESNTDKEGWVEIPESAVIGRRANAPSHLVVKHNQDLTYIDLNNSPLDLSTFNIGGRVLSTQADAFVFTDRGVYRPRETVYISSIVRDQMGRNTVSGELELVVFRPNGTKHSTRKVSTSSLGAISEELLLPADAPRGIWSLAIFHKGEQKQIGSSQIDVQDFVPEKLKVEVVKRPTTATLGQTITTNIQADYLFGSPGIDLAIEAEAFLLTVDARELRPDLAGYMFGDELIRFRTGPLVTKTQNTNEKGLGLVEVETSGVNFSRLPNGLQASLPSRAQINIAVQEPGGRTSKTIASQDILSNLPILGVRPNFNGQVDTSEGASFMVKKLSPELVSLSTQGLKWDVRRRTTRWDYERSSGRWKYTQVISESITAQGEVTTRNSALQEGHIRLEPLQWGEYVLTVTDEKDRIYHRSTFYSGWSSNADTNQPDFLEVKSSSPNFKPSTTIEIGVESPYEGKGLVTVWTDRPVLTQSVDFKKGTNNFQLKTQSDWFPGVYVVVSALRPLGNQNTTDTLSVDRYMPARSMGVLYLEAESSRKLTITAPVLVPIKPRTEQTLEINIPTLKGKTGYVLVQAVDQGILQLTNFKTPAPQEHFFGKRRLQTSFYDYYNQLIRADGQLGEFRTGGDTPSLGGASLDVVPTKSTVIYSGPTAVDQSGQAKIKIPVPDFNGSLRTMVTVWSDDSYGSHEQVWVVRDPVVAEVVMPRFIAPGDESTASLILVNTTEMPQSASVEVKASGDLFGKFSNIRETLSPGQQKQIQLPIKGIAQGQGALAISLRVAGQETVTREWPISVTYSGNSSKFNGPLTNLRSGQKTVLTLDFAAQAQATGRSGYVLISQDTGLLSTLPPSFSAASLISELAAYRWTCSEQISSTFTPVVMAYQTDPTFTGQVLRPFIADSDVRAWLQDKLDQIISRQSVDGSIGLWRQGDDYVDATLAAQLVEMLAHARLIGLQMPDDALSSAFNWATKLSQNNSESEAEKYRSLTRMLKAMSAHSPRSIRVARGLVDQLKEMDLLSKSNLAVALKSHGDNSRLNDVVGNIRRSHQDSKALDTAFSNRSTWRYHESGVSLLMQHASNLMELGLKPEADATIKAAIQEIQKRGLWANVNEQGHVLRSHIASTDKTTTEVIVGGVSYEARLGSIVATLPSDVLEASNGRINVESRSSSPLSAMVVLTAPPKPKTRLPATSKWVTVETKFYTLDGQERKQGLHQSKVTEKFIVYLNAKIDRRNFGTSRQIMVSSPVPAGFQIESILNNATRENLYEWLPELSVADVQQAQDTGYFASSIINNNWNWEGEFKLAFMVRATTPGQYLAVETVVEDMYDPTFRGTSGGQPITVRPTK